MEDPWHNWHKPEEAPGTEVAAAVCWQGYQHLLCPSASVVAELHHADLMSLVTP